MNRREALKCVGAILGGTIISGTSFLSCGDAKSKGNNPQKKFATSDVALLNEVAETIIPTTDTPGAKAANVGGFMVTMISDCYSPKNQASFHRGLNKIRRDFRDQFGSSFINGKLNERRHFLNNLDDQIQSYNQTKKLDDPEFYFSIMKELVLLGYFTSKIGCAQARRYVLTPGKYKVEIPYKNQRAWANNIPGSS